MKYFILFIIILIIILYVSNNSELFGSISEVDGETNLDNKTLFNMAQNNEMTQNTVNLLKDPAFSDLIYYSNDFNPYEPGQYLGLQKCFSECNGTCVEFGITGNAFCFPKKTF